MEFNIQSIFSPSFYGLRSILQKIVYIFFEFIRFFKFTFFYSALRLLFIIITNLYYYHY